MLKNALDFEKPIAELDAEMQRLREHMENPDLQTWCDEHGRDYQAELDKLREGLEQLGKDRTRLMKDIFSRLTPWEKTQVARHRDRPHTLDFLRLIFEDFLELHGDRAYADDASIVGGLAKMQGRRVMVIGHEKGRDLKDKVRRNYGSAKPEGYRKAIRLAKLAERTGRPVLFFVDTSAADSSVGSEERGISAAIAWSMLEISQLTVPTIVVVIGEGGSGGAIGIGVGDRVLMLEHAVYSVIPPEGCANILWRDAGRAGDAAAALKLTAGDALALGVIDEILPEPLGGAHRDIDCTANTIKEAVLRHLEALETMDSASLLATRYDKFRRMGDWITLSDPHATALDGAPTPAPV